MAHYRAQEIDLLIKEFPEGDIESLAQKLQRSNSTLRHYANQTLKLKRAVPLSLYEDFHQEFQSFPCYDKFLSLCSTPILKSRLLTARRSPSLDTYFFDVVSCSQAFLLGYLLINGRFKDRSITLISSELNILERLKLLISASFPIKKRNQKTYTLEITNSFFVKLLQYQFNFPNFPSLPDNLYPDLLYGIYLAASTYDPIIPRISFKLWKRLKSDFLWSMNRVFNLENPKIESKPSYFNLSWQGSSAAMIHQRFTSLDEEFLVYERERYRSISSFAGSQDDSDRSSS